MLYRLKNNINTPEAILYNFLACRVNYSFDIENYNEKLANFLNHSCAFDWIHTGHSSMLISELIAFFKDSPHISPPRTGHLGLWEEIVNGRSGALSHNEVICSNQFGYPLIFDINQTENLQKNNGDSVYLPGSKIENNELQALKLYTWNGEKIIEQDRQDPIFVPFAKVKTANGWLPLTSLHKNREFMYKDTDYLSSVVLQNRLQLEQLLIKTIDYIAKGNSFLKLEDIIDREVNLSGKITRSKLLFINGSYFSKNAVYNNTEHLVAAVFLPFIAANNYEEFFEIRSKEMHVFPMISLAFVHVICCVFNTHFSREYKIRCQDFTKPFNTHFHWGAFDMAGHPPDSNGYLKHKRDVIKNIFKVILELDKKLSPCLFILLPSTIFMMLPHNIFPKDCKLVAELFSLIIASKARLYKLFPELRYPYIENLVSNWLKLHHNSLSKEYINRFIKKRVIYNQNNPTGHHLLLSEFCQLSLQEACMVLTALFSTMKKYNSIIAFK